MGKFYQILEDDPVYSRETEKRFVEILEEDDPDKFFKLLEEKKEEVVPATYRNLLELCIEEQASKCTVAFLKAEFREDNYPLSDLCPSVIPHIVRCWPDKDVLETMFKECGAEFLVSRTARIPDFLAIHELLLDTMNQLPFATWFKGDSIIKLVIMLISAPNMRQRLECLGLIANHTYQIKKVALGFFNGGDVRELAALLLLSYPKAFPPVQSALTAVAPEDLASRVLHGGNPDVFGILLVQLFEKAGDRLSKYYTSLQEDVDVQDVIVEAARLIKDAGLTVTYNDIDLAEEFSLEPAVMDSMCKALGIKKDEGKEDEERGYPSVYRYTPAVLPGMPSGDYRVLGNLEYAYQAFHRVPVREYSTVSHNLSQNHKITSSKQSWSRPSLRSVSFLAMRLKRGLRFL